MKFSNKTYDILKWIAQIFLPAAITLFGTIGTTLGFEYTQQVLTISIAVDTFLGAILGISTAQYNKELIKKEEEANGNESD